MAETNQMSRYLRDLARDSVQTKNASGVTGKLLRVAELLEADVSFDDAWKKVGFPGWVGRILSKLADRGMKGRAKKAEDPLASPASNLFPQNLSSNPTGMLGELQGQLNRPAWSNQLTPGPVGGSPVTTVPFGPQNPPWSNQLTPNIAPGGRYPASAPPPVSGTLAYGGGHFGDWMAGQRRATAQQAGRSPTGAPAWTPPPNPADPGYLNLEANRDAFFDQQAARMQAPGSAQPTQQPMFGNLPLPSTPMPARSSRPLIANGTGEYGRPARTSGQPPAQMPQTIQQAPQPAMAQVPAEPVSSTTPPVEQSVPAQTAPPPAAPAVQTPGQPAGRPQTASVTQPRVVSPQAPIPQSALGPGGPRVTYGSGLAGQQAAGTAPLTIPQRNSQFAANGLGGKTYGGGAKATIGSGGKITLQGTPKGSGPTGSIVAGANRSRRRTS